MFAPYVVAEWAGLSALFRTNVSPAPSRCLLRSPCCSKARHTLPRSKEMKDPKTYGIEEYLNASKNQKTQYLPYCLERKPSPLPPAFLCPRGC